MSNEPKKILLLDDDYESMHNLQDYLEEEFGWNVELSADKELLQRFRNEQVDLIIVDLMIRPISLDVNGQKIQNIHYDDVKWDRTGLEFIRRFRHGEYTQKDKGTSVDVPIIVLSAVADSTADREWGKIIQAEQHIEKPFRLSELVKLIQRLLQG